VKYEVFFGLRPGKGGEVGIRFLFCCLFLAGMCGEVGVEGRERGKEGGRQVVAFR